MATRDIISKTKVINVLPLATRTTTATSTSVDTQSFDAVSFVLFYGQAGDTLSGTVTIEADLQYSDDNATFFAVPDVDLLVEATAARPGGGAIGIANGAATTGAGFYATASAQLPAGTTTVRMGYIGVHRYVRLSDTRVGTQATGTPSSAVAVLGLPSYNPTSGNQS